MYPKVVQEPLGRDGEFPYSCLACRQRKIKCDRRPNCSNCTKTAKQCVFVAPVRGKRRRTKPAREGLHAKLKRYEELLKSYGANIEPSEDFNDSDSGSEMTSQADVEMTEGLESRSETRADPYELEYTQPKLVTKEGTSRYYDSILYSNLGDQFPQLEVTMLGGPVEEPVEREDDILFEAVPHLGAEGLRSMHFPFQILLKLKEIYVERVDALVKVMHMPTFWAALTNGLQRPQEMSKSLEAEVFAFYFVVICAMKEDECQNLLGSPKSILYTRYRHATRQALMNAEFLSTANPTILRAFTVFIICLRKSLGGDTLYMYSAIAVRLARKMGLHRDGTSLGLPPFETEMRRRLWWHVALVDFRLAEVLGTRPSLDLTSGDVRPPLNVEDEDLRPDMTEAPPERDGITSVTPNRIRCDVIDLLRRFATCPGDVRWESLYAPDVPLARKDAAVAELEDRWERSYVRYCDLCEPFHTFISLMLRSAICKLRLFAHSPRRFIGKSSASGNRNSAGRVGGGSGNSSERGFVSSPLVPRVERDIVFENAVKMLEYAALAYEGGRGLDRYMWQIGTSYLWNTMLTVLIEARHRKTGPKVDRLWQLIGVMFSHSNRALQEPAGPVHNALGKWTLEVWDHYVAASVAEGLPRPQSPDYIDAIRRRITSINSSSTSSKTALVSTTTSATESASSLSSPSWSQGQSPTAARKPPAQTKFQPEGYDNGGLPELDSFGSYDFPDLLSFETDPNEWVQWDQLLAGQNGFAQFDSVNF
ncbi:C6 transcription factor [Hypoxylon sp. FL1284]|nr:C6 transcription factor [Hypoxylon sp. FL1284]